MMADKVGKIELTDSPPLDVRGSPLTLSQQGTEQRASRALIVRADRALAEMNGAVRSLITALGTQAAQDEIAGVEEALRQGRVARHIRRTHDG
jgi:hypothetical protein